MSSTLWPTNGTYQGRQLRQAIGALWGAVSGRPLGASSGVSVGTPTGTVTAAGSTWTVNPHRGVLDVETNAIAGPYHYSYDSAQTGTLNAPDNAHDRIDLLSVTMSDTSEGDGSTAGPTIIYTAGTPASSPSPPATPAKNMALATVRVPVLGGGSPVVTWVAPWAVAAGGLLPVAGASAYPSAPYQGQAIFDQSSQRLFVWDGGRWAPYTPAAARQMARTTSLNLAPSTPTTPTSFGGGTTYNNGDFAYASGVYTSPRAQMVEWELVSSWPATTDVHARVFWVRLNGTDDDRGRNSIPFDAPHGPTIMTAGGKIPVNAGDTLQPVLWQSTTGTVAVVPEFWTITGVG